MNTVDEIPVELGRLIERITILRQDIAQAAPAVDYAGKDARHVALDGMQQALVGAGMLINSLLAFDSLDHLLRVAGRSLPLVPNDECMFTFIRFGVVTQVHFKMESLFHDILKDPRVQQAPTRPGFWSLGNAILDFVGRSKTGSEKETLTVLANIRNSFHNNGIHNQDNFTKVIGSETFTFVKGHRVECASWHHVVTAFGGNIDVLEAILLSPKVTALDTKIVDQFEETC